jgi:signal transduction histidine kinase/ActR/RegA family two-component response regulator
VSADPKLDARVLVLAPWGHDGLMAAEVLEEAGIVAEVVSGVVPLCEEAQRGAAALLLTVEVLDRPALESFASLLEAQEPWSDLPIVILTGRGGGEPLSRETLSTLGNVTLLERPLELVTLLSAVRSAVRARHRQYGARRAAEVLRDSDRRKTEFLAILSHELRNPLAAISNATHLLAHPAANEAQSRRARDVIVRQTGQLARLVDDLLDLTRIERGKIDLKPRRMDLAEIIGRTCEDHEALFEDRGIALHCQNSGPVWIDGDPTRIAQVIGNLLQNAARYGHPGGTVMVETSLLIDHAELRVRDDGRGIAPDLLPRLFTPFVQAEDGLSRAHGGLGLGLSLVKLLVELHGGSVRAQSDGPGRGAEFILTLPLAEAPSARGAGKPSPARTGPFHLLIIEDNRDAAQMLADVLESEGHQVHLARDAGTGLALARSLAPDVVLCDIGLPDVDGYTLAHAMRKEPALAHTRLIAISGYAQEQDRARAEQAGFDAHIVKPADLEELERVLGSTRSDPAEP